MIHAQDRRRHNPLILIGEEVLKMAEDMRLDTELVNRGLCSSRTKAQRLIENGCVLVNGQVSLKPSLRISDVDSVLISGEVCPYVSRGGLKLEKALKCFECDVHNLVCVDVGASTGGFTDVLLRNGAAFVYALDVGRAQLHPSLLRDPRVRSMEQMNARYLNKSLFSPCPQFAVMDVSFISVKLILPALLSLLGDEGRLITLIKPQFEVGRSNVGKNGIVRSPLAHIDAIAGVMFAASALKWHINELTYSPITGQDGNIEYLAYVIPDRVSDSPAIRDDEIESVVTQAFKSLHAPG